MPSDAADERSLTATLMRREAIPNWLTGARVVFAGLFLFLLSVYRFPHAHRWALPAAAGLFIVAALTDALDGYLARKWSATSLFGRVMDPFADKVLVIGAFIMLCGPAFAVASGDRTAVVTGVAPWMVAIILARELLVTSIRGVYEARGVSFPADWSGKWKMILQSVAVPVVLMVVWSAPEATAEHALQGGWRRWTINVVVWLTVLVTLLSGWTYVSRAYASRFGARAPGSGA